MRVVSVILAAAAAVALLCTGCTNRSAPAPVPIDASVPAGTGPVVVFVGDSIVRGSTVRPAERWTALLAAERGWREVNLGCPGAGFAQVGDCGGTFARQLPAIRRLVARHSPALIVVPASRNDLRASDRATFRRMDAFLRGLVAAADGTPVVALSAIWTADEIPARLDSINLRWAADAALFDVPFVDVGNPPGGHPSDMATDGIHLDPAGNERMARAVSQALQRSGLAVPPRAD